MAKKKVILEGQVILDDKGTLKDTAKGAHSVDRRLKGAARTSSNATKNFSKMSQGISGGLVPAYATLAANIFAIGAAFRFLSEAANYRILVEGQREFATVTGESLELLTARLQEATGGQLAFAEAAQSVAIARAAGVTSDQLERLGNLAKNASVALGRDLTDSLNRLIRGVTKAEPELLDELGIILRLEVATKKYAQEIGKTKDQLTIFEKSQAVVNEVLEQGEDKFGNFETSLNKFSLAAKSFDDMLNKIKMSITFVAEFIAGGLSRNLVGLAASFGVVASSILKSIVPAATTIDTMAAGQQAMGDVGKFYSGSRLEKIQSGDYNQKDLNQIKKSMNAKKSSVLNFERFRRSEALKTIKYLEMLNLEREVTEGNSFQRMKAKFLLSLKSMQAEYGKFIGFMKFAWLGFTKLLSAVGWIGVVVSAFSVLKPFIDKLRDPAIVKFEESQKRIIDKYKKQTEALNELNEGLQRQRTLLAGIVQMSNFFGNFDFSGGATAFGTTARATRDPIGQTSNILAAGLAGMGTGGFVSSNVSAPVTALDKGQTTILEETIKNLETMQSRLVEGGAEYIEIAGYIEMFQSALDESNSELGIMPGHVDQVVLMLDKLGENSTKAQTNLAGFASTTQILSGAAQSFGEAMAGLKSKSTGLSQITSAMEGTGSALLTLGTADYSGIKDFEENYNKVFDSATQGLARSFIGDEAVDRVLNNDNLTQMEKMAEIGRLVSAEAKRFHEIEIGLLTDKLNIETQLIEDKKGQPKLLQQQLDKEGKVKILKQQILDIEKQRDALIGKGGEENAAQLVLEEAKLNKLRAQLEVAKDVASLASQAYQTFVDTLGSSLTTALNDFATGAKNMKEAFLDMTQSILKAMVQILAQQAAMKILGVFGFAPVGGRSGGTFNSPGYRSFASGGIAQGPKSGYPVTLHGREAVVPLGNDRSIPVEFKGGGGDMNPNITVNVSTMGGQTTTAGNSTNQQKQLGQAVAAAVQAELLDQQKPGGILSPYGNGGDI